ncbi:hypothetical protein AB0N99_21250 [Streptomyces sp. NPDC093272]|uniref:hypothetical protein n=1 Tax=Streptomyces sp. NPDC093272 TaxID=3154981 RepID=UPI00343797F6
MTQNSNDPEMLETPRGRVSEAVVAESTVPQLIARPVPVQTSGRTEFAARCPQCRDWHRHIGLGEKEAPCGAHYRLEFASRGAA